MNKTPLWVAFMMVSLLFPFESADAVVRSITFPVAGTFSFRDDFAEPRGDGSRTHLGIDIIADKMTPVVATVDGVVTYVAIPQASWGYSITISDSEGYSYRYLHLNNDTPGTDDGQGGEAHAYASGIARRVTVSKGQVIGWVGDSGNAETTVSHLHFEIRGPDRVNINPYETLFAAAGGTGSGTFVEPVTSGSMGSIDVEEQFIPTRLLKEGDVDREVLTLHNDLKTLGYFSGTPTEVYDSVTREAIRRFQVERKLFATGIADAETRKAIEAAVKAAPVTSTPTTTSSTLKEGAGGASVRALQEKLKTLGFFSGEVTGYFGPITRAAVIAFQRSLGLEPVGYVGPKTRAALDAVAVSQTAPSSTSVSLTHYLEIGARGDEVRALQTVLKRAGVFTEEVTGYFGTLTRAAVIAFQSAHDIEPLGVVGPKTRAVLNTL
ncbi:MAG: peptidoglycan-binding protein [Patescibacteria group bacterium]